MTSPFTAELNSIRAAVGGGGHWHSTIPSFAELEKENALLRSQLASYRIRDVEARRAVAELFDGWARLQAGELVAPLKSVMERAISDLRDWRLESEGTEVEAIMGMIDLLEALEERP